MRPKIRPNSLTQIQVKLRPTTPHPNSIPHITVTLTLFQTNPDSYPVPDIKHNFAPHEFPMDFSTIPRWNLGIGGGAGPFCVEGIPNPKQLPPPPCLLGCWKLIGTGEKDNKHKKNAVNADGTELCISWFFSMHNIADEHCVGWPSINIHTKPNMICWQSEHQDTCKIVPLWTGCLLFCWMMFSLPATFPQQNLTPNYFTMYQQNDHW